MADQNNDNKLLTRKEFGKYLAGWLGGTALLSQWPLSLINNKQTSDNKEGFPNIISNRRKDKPNLLLIQTDQQRPDTMQAYGNDFIDTPNLNRLADESIVFRNFYVSQPVCTPSRGTIQTGLYPHQHGATFNNIPLPEEVPAIPELVNDSDYRTAMFGKWHLGDEIFPHHGYEQWASTEDKYMQDKYYANDFISEGRDNSKRSKYFHWLKSKGVTLPKGKAYFDRPFTSRLPLKYSKSTYLRKKTVDFIRTNKNNPFICNVSILNPHPPFYGPLDDYYNPHDIQLSPNVGISPSKNDPLGYRLRASSHKNQSREAWKRLVAKYYGLVTQVDLNIGIILQELESLGLKDNTVVAFTSDHGEMLGSHNMTSKKVMYEESSKVPFLLRDPANKFKKFTINSPVSSINIVPTLLDSLNRENVDYSRFPGFSLLDFINGGSLKQDHVFIEWIPSYTRAPSEHLPNPGNKVPKEKFERIYHQNTRAVVSPSGWKLCISDNDTNQLYNLQEDPYELNNLYYTGAYDNVIKLLFDRIHKWQRRTNDELNLKI